MLGDRSAQTVRRSDHDTGRITAVTHRGLVRARNEDDFFLSADGRLLVVADGLGGLPAGDVASRTAVETLAECYAAADPAVLEDVVRRRTFLFDSFQAAHERILARSRSRRDGNYMATTLVAALALADSLLVGHVGDVRGYRYSAERFEQVTRDHSLVGDLVAAGAISAEEARSHPQRNLVTRALGLPEPLDPSFVVTPLVHGDLVVLCTDGLWETLPHAHFGSIVGDQTSGPKWKADELVMRALAAGGRDNITVVVYEHAVGYEKAESG